MTSIGAIDRMIFSNPHARTKAKNMLASIGFNATHWEVRRASMVNC
jgi:hypothetical protein